MYRRWAMWGNGVVEVVEKNCAALLTGAWRSVSVATGFVSRSAAMTRHTKRVGDVAKATEHEPGTARDLHSQSVSQSVSSLQSA